MKILLLTILSLYTLLISQVALSEVPSTYSGLQNPCTEGDFLDIGESQCKTLDKSFGFDEAQFIAALPTQVAIVSACTEAAWQTAYNIIKNNGGGTINIGTCDITLTQQYYLPSNTLIQGKGTTKTILRYGSSFNSSSMFRSDTNNRVTNLVIRDIKFIGTKTSVNAAMILLFSNGSNILIERVHVSKASKSGFLYPHTQKLTLRYSTFTDNVNHGAGNKDCYPHTVGVPGSEDKFFCDGGDPDFWSYDISIYSVYAYDNGDVGIDPHSSDFEFAGNKFHGNGQNNVKIPEKAIRVWAHDNYAYNPGLSNIATKSQYCATMNSDWQTDKHVYYRNRLENGSVGTNSYYALYSTNVTLIDNIYRNNGNNNEWSHNSSCADTSAMNLSTVNICPSRGEMNENNDVGNGTLTILSAGDSKCDLANVGSIF